MIKGSISMQEVESNMDSNHSGSELLIKIDENVSFVIDENCDIEYEVKKSIKQCLNMILSYLYRVAIISLLLITVLYFQGLLMFMSDTYYMTTNRIPLLDRLHQLLDRYDHPFTPTLCHIFMFTFAFTGIFRIVLFSPLYYFLQMLLRYVALFGTAYFLRGFFVYVTTMPSCYYNCNSNLERKSFFPFLIRIISGYMGLVTNCSDLIISGHTMFTVITCILFAENVKYLITKIVLVLATGFILFTIIACKYHYTVDILFGILVAYLLHYFYMTKIDAYGVYFVNRIENPNNTQLEKNKKSMLFGSFLAKLIVSMELLEERLILGQKLRILYLYVNSKPNVIDEKLKNKFNHYVRLFGADESDDLLTLYRGTRMFNFYYWKYFYCKIFKKQNAVVL